MKKYKSLYILGIVFIFLFSSCRPPDQRSELEKLEKQRDALSARIEQLRAGIGAAGTPAQVPRSAVPVQVLKIAPGMFRHFIRVQGSVESDNNILVPPKSPGIVKKLHVKAGDRVSKGQLLAELDAAVLESSLVELENGLALARTIFERQERLWKKNIGSEIEFLQAKNNKEGLEMKLETLREQLNLMKILAPIEGTVDNVLIKEGEMAAAGFGAVRIVQLSRLKIVSSLAENYISRVKKGDVVRVLIPVIGREFDQTVSAVSQVIDPDNRTFEIEIQIPRSERDIKPNMLAVITINDYSKPDALTVPQNIIQETGSSKFLFVAVETGGSWRAERREVMTGESYDNQVEVLTGIQPGESVITLGFQSLADGQSIQPNTLD